MQLQTKTSLQNLLAQVQGLVSHSERQAIESLSDKLQANKFTLAVLGQFKRGKTTFINALLGEDLLPTAVIPLTSVITVLHYGQSLNIKIFFNSGKTKDIRLSELSQYVTEKFNPKNEKNVHHVEISHPSPYLKQGIQIVDTPGIASIHEHNTQTTYEFLPQADAGIFLVSVDPPITQAEYQFLNDIKALLPKLFFVQNKIDTLNRQDWQESLEFTKQVIQKHVGLTDIKIFPLSAKLALEAKQKNNLAKLRDSGLLDFEEILGKFVVKDKENVLLKSVTNKTLRIVEQEILLANIKLQSLQSSKQELEEKLSQFNASLSVIQQQQIQDDYLLKGEIQTIIKTLERDLEELKAKATADFEQALEQWYGKHKTESTKGLETVLNSYIAEKLQEIFLKWKAGEEEKLQQLLQQALRQFSDKANLIINQIMANAAELFGLSFNKLNVREKLSEVSGFDFMLREDEVQISLDMISQAALHLLPGFLGHKIVLKKMRKYATDMVDRHCGRLHYDLVQRIDKAQKNFKAQMHHNIQNLTEQIIQAIKLGQELESKTKAEAQILQSEFQTQLNSLSGIKQQLQTL